MDSRRDAALFGLRVEARDFGAEDFAGGNSSHRGSRDLFRLAQVAFSRTKEKDRINIRSPSFAAELFC